MRLHLTSTDLPRRAAGHAAALAGRVLEAPLGGLRHAGQVVLRPGGRHLGIVVAVATAGLCGLLSWLLGSGLQQWFVAEGMDDERAYLLGAMVLVLLATAIAGAASRRPGATRLGGLAGFTGIQIVPFLLRAAGEPVTPGLRYTQDILGWILQPLGMLLLGLICVIVGAALGVGLARDAARVPALLRRRWVWLAIPVALALIVAASAAAVTALQDGPFAALRDYTVATASHTPAARATSAVGPTPVPVESAPDPEHRPAAPAPGVRRTSHRLGTRRRRLRPRHLRRRHRALVPGHLPAPRYAGVPGRLAQRRPAPGGARPADRERHHPPDDRGAAQRR